MDSTLSESTHKLCLVGKVIYYALVQDGLPLSFSRKVKLIRFLQSVFKTEEKNESG